MSAATSGRFLLGLATNISGMLVMRETCTKSVTPSYGTRLTSAAAPEWVELLVSTSV